MAISGVGNSTRDITHRGPVLFLTFINDLPQYLTCECSMQMTAPPIHCREKHTADRRNPSLNLDYASDIGPRHGASYSALRRVNIFWISPTTQSLNPSEVFIHGSYTCIPRVTTHKHLGIHTNSRVSWPQDHIDHCVHRPCNEDWHSALPAT